MLNCESCNYYTAPGGHPCGLVQYTKPEFGCIYHTYRRWFDAPDGPGWWWIIDKHRVLKMAWIQLMEDGVVYVNGVSRSMKSLGTMCKWQRADVPVIPDHGKDK